MSPTALDETLILSEPVQHIQDVRKNYGHLSRGIAAGHGSIWEQEVTDKNNFQSRTDRTFCLYVLQGVYNLHIPYTHMYIYIYIHIDI